MKKAVVLFLLFFLFTIPVVKSCPFCNIHNYMSSSLYAAKNIVLGKVVSKNKEGTKLKVLEILKGDSLFLPADSIIDWPHVYSSEGETMIFCDIKNAYPPSFDSFLPETAREIRFLLSNDTLPRNLDEAKTCLEGISADAVHSAISYFRANYKESFPALSAMVDSVVYGCGKKNRYYFFSEWEIGNLFRAYFVVPDEEAKKHIMAVTDHFYDSLSDEKSKWNCCNTGMVLYKMLSASSKQEDIHKEIKTKLINILPEVRGQQLEELAFALVQSGSSPEEIYKLISPGESDYLSLALLRCSAFEERWWQWKDAKELANDAKKYAKERSTIKKAEEQLKSLERFK